MPDKLYAKEQFFAGKDDLSPDEKMFRCADCKKTFYKKYDAKQSFFHKAGKIWIPMSMYAGKPDYDYEYTGGKKLRVLYSVRCPLCNSDKNIEGHIDESTPLLLNGIVKLLNGRVLKTQ